METLKHVDFGDHELAAYLRDSGAIDNYEHMGNITLWRNSHDVVVAMVVYPGPHVAKLDGLTKKVYVLK